MSAQPSFDVRAGRYEELRPVDDNWWEVFEILVRLGDLRGRRILEVGCGTGRLSQGLAERVVARAWAVDLSPEMVARAKSLGLNARVARAEALPFKRDWFEAVAMRMMIHLCDRNRAFAEAARVLGPGGRIVIATEDPASFGEVWFTEFFPSVPAIDGARFPSAEALTRELASAGFEEIRIEKLRQHRRIDRERALELLRSRAFSTFDLIPEAEYAAGLARAEGELPEAFDYHFDWLLAVARTPPGPLLQSDP